MSCLELVVEKCFRAADGAEARAGRLNRTKAFVTGTDMSKDLIERYLEFAIQG
jgi:hypothetical protein